MSFTNWESTFIARMNLSQKDRELISLYCKDTVTADEAADYFDGIIFEESQYDVCCLIAQMCARHNYTGTPEELIPKIKGLARYLTTMNALRTVELFKFIKAINQAEIPVMLIKGAAIRIGYFPKVNRYMADTDIYVAGKNYNRTVKLAKDYGCEGISSYHSIDLKKGPLALDVHKVFVKELLNGANPDGIWHRATKADQNGVSFYIPSREDMIIQILVTGFYDLFESSRDKEKKHIKWITDILPFLLDEEKIDWEKTASIAEQLKISDQIKVMIYALGNILPQNINTGEVLGYFSTGKVNQKARNLYEDLYNMYITHCEHVNINKSIPEVILYWAKYTWVICRYFSGHENLWRAMINYPGFCAVTMQTGEVKDIPGEMISRINKRARAKR
ncbi:MAG TPA: nucleotidyltransferase family protein [Syntrophomonadaceae bacterium]|nr:nucleotidyltransferase family protein [Syntrophomonadaceae bacterium]HNX28918.1 nucleotidyltransferase family protein [Syntrophomonadaceae bacterium]HPR94233.1 nucleotidyltransferase family protein [Syntrophomonadaceae bacterium]